MYNYIDLFHGIGGFALGAYWAGMKFENHFCSDIEPYTQKLYKLRFPDSIQLGDITKIDYEDLKQYGNKWIVSAGFPCQPHSQAGSKKASKDERDLWPECFRMLRILRPEAALFENVSDLLTSESGEFFNGILSDISSIGYNCEWTIISAFDAGAPHLRERVWIVAYPDSEDVQRGFTKKKSNWKPIRTIFISEFWRTENKEKLLSTPKLCGTNDGISNRVDRTKGLGNAIVPQIAEILFRQIKPMIQPGESRPCE